MPKFLTTSGVSHHLEKIIANAEQKLLLISPYLQINPHLRLLLQDSNIDAIKADIVYGKYKETKDLEWIRNSTKLNISFYEMLHAKCYLNEKEVILTSMNLFEYSQQNNCEMGILATLKDDPDFYTEILKEAERILRQAEVIHKINRIEKSNENNSWKPKNKEERFNKNRKGYCIRTGTEIPFDVERPLCFKAFNSWEQFGDEYYPEKYCHFSGEKSNGETYYARPILKRNWKEAQRVFGL